MQKYTGKLVTALNYNLFTKEERANSHKELKAYLKGKTEFKAKIPITGEDGEVTYKNIMRKVNVAK